MVFLKTFNEAVVYLPISWGLEASPWLIQSDLHGNAEAKPLNKLHDFLYFSTPSFFILPEALASDEYLYSHSV